MTKLEFLEQLCTKLCHLPPEKIAHARHYYSGLIDGRIESGKTEEEAIEQFGSADKTALEFINRISSPRKHRISVKIKAMPQGWRTVLTVLLTVCCYLLLAAMWAACAAIWAVCGIVLIGGVLTAVLGVVLCVIYVLPIGLCVIGAGLVTAAVGLLLIVPSRAATGLFASITGAINARIRALLAKEALSV